MVRINCLACGKPLNIPSYVDAEDYDGQIRCQGCDALLYVRFKSSKVRKYKVVERQPTDERPIWNIIVNSERTKKLTEAVGKRLEKRDLDKH
jgi:DNA-directed RNA polymerase subunit RPC12/RpoP